MTEVLHQSQAAKSAEIAFRSRLVRQHLTNQLVFPHEYTASQMHQEFLAKLARQRQDFTRMAPGVLASPFVEIGAGYGQTSLLVTNEFKLTGFATDLSPQPLLSLPKVARKLGYTKLPKLVICDALHLPFPTGSIPFVYCYQTLHHFPHPGPILSEIFRVLRPGGYFYFGEEPVSQLINLNLWRRPTKLRWWELPLKYTGLLHFISRIGKTEVDLGIHEETFSISTWTQSLAPFTHISSTLTPFPTGPTGSLTKFSLLNRLALAIMGGGISGLFQKPTGSKRSPVYLTCPTCKFHPRLKRLRCPNCHTKYSHTNQTPILLPAELLHYVA